MASSTRRPRKKYDTPGTANDNLARKLDGRELERRLERSGQVDFDQQYRQRRETEAERRSRQRAKAKAAVRPAQKVNILAVLAFFGIAADGGRPAVLYPAQRHLPEHRAHEDGDHGAGGGAGGPADQV